MEHAPHPRVVEIELHAVTSRSRVQDLDDLPVRARRDLHDLARLYAGSGDAGELLLACMTVYASDTECTNALRCSSARW